MQPILSIIVPVFKAEQYLNKCVESIVNQTYKNLEIILVDDGSPDRCGEMCDEWAKRDGRIKVIHQENAGVSMARNNGLKASNGDWIGFVDSDDNIPISAYEDLISYVNVRNVDVIEGNVYWIDKHGNYSTFFPDIEIKQKKEYDGVELFSLMVNEKIYSSMCNKIFRKDLFDYIKFQPNTRAEDYRFLAELMPILYKRKSRFISIPQYVYNYYENVEGFCSTNTGTVILQQLRHRFETVQSYSEILPKSTYINSLNVESWIVFLGIRRLFFYKTHPLYNEKEKLKEWMCYVKQVPWSLFFKAKIKNPLRFCQFFLQKYFL